MSTYKSWFLAHAKNEHIIFPDEISTVSATYYVCYRVLKWLKVNKLGVCGHFRDLKVALN